MAGQNYCQLVKDSLAALESDPTAVDDDVLMTLSLKWSEADKSLESREETCRDGYLHLAAKLLKIYETTQRSLGADYIRKVCGGLSYNLSRSLPSSRLVRQSFEDSGILDCLDYMQSQDDLPANNFKSGLILAFSACAGGKRVQNHELSSTLICKCLHETLQNNSFFGTYWSEQEILEAAAALCHNPQNRSAVTKANILPDLIRCLDVSSETIKAALACLSKLASCDACRPYLMENISSFQDYLDDFKISDDISVRSFALSIIFSLNPNDQDIHNALLKAAEFGSKRWNRSQIFLVGKGRSGKTSFLNAMQQRDFQHTESTVGMDCLTLQMTSLSSGKGWLSVQNDNGAGEETIAKAELAAAIARGDSLQGTGRSVIDELHGEKSGKAQAIGKSPSCGALGQEEKSTSMRKKEGLASSKARSGTDEAGLELGIRKMEHDLIVRCMQDEGAANEITFECWDFGGQEVFYTLHHLFLTPYGVYLVIFDMQDLLGEERREEALDYLEFWLSSIFLHTQAKGKSECSPMLLVGTHKDVVPDEESHRMISKLLSDRFRESMATTAWPHLEQYDQRGLCFFPVDNTIGHTDSVIPCILRLIEDLSRSADYIQMEVPFKWLRCFDELKRQDQKHLSIASVVKTAQGVGMPITKKMSLDDEVAMFLDFFHRLGKLMHFKDKSLCDDVIMKPFEFLIAPATMIICDHAIHSASGKRRARALPREWGQLTEDALLSRKLLPVLWESFYSSEGEMQLLLDLLFKFGLAIPLKQAAPKQVGADSELQCGKDDELFLVPSLLKDKQLTESRSNFLVFYFIFSLNGSASMQQNSVRLADVVGRFLPMGFFPRLVGKCVSWSQYTGGMQPILSKKEVELAFGEQKFMLQELTKEQCIRVWVEGKSPREIQIRLDLLVLDVIKECMPNLSRRIMIPYAAGEGAVVDLERVQESVQSRQPLWVNTDAFQPEQLQAAYAAWLPPTDLLDHYHAFLSYRQGPTDSVLVMRLFDCLSLRVIGEHKERVEVFWDQARLVSGRRFDSDFMNGMTKSVGVVPVVSLDALARMRDITSEGEAVDNVLLEWTLALELQEIRAADGFFVLPLVLGRVTSEPEMSVSNFFAEECHPVEALPAVVSRPVVRRVEEFLRSAGIPLLASSSLATRTVRDTVRAVLANKGVLVWNVQSRLREQACGVAEGQAAGFKWDLYEQCAKEVMKTISSSLARQAAGFSSGGADNGGLWNGRTGGGQSVPPCMAGIELACSAPASGDQLLAELMDERATSWGTRTQVLSAGMPPPPPPPLPPLPDDLAEWMRGERLDSLEPWLAREEMTLEALRCTTEADLDRLSLPLGKLVVLRGAIARLQGKNPRQLDVAPGAARLVEELPLRGSRSLLAEAAKAVAAPGTAQGKPDLARGETVAVTVDGGVERSLRLAPADRLRGEEVRRCAGGEAVPAAWADPEAEEWLRKEGLEGLRRVLARERLGMRALRALEAGDLGQATGLTLGDRVLLREACRRIPGSRIAAAETAAESAANYVCGRGDSDADLGPGRGARDGAGAVGCTCSVS